ncbi:hypothetical protein ScPMuIL_007217 [Solemya velum]
MSVVQITHKLFASRFSGIQYVQIATLKNLTPPPKYGKTEYPERRKLRFFDKVPQLPPDRRPMKMMRDIGLMRGPEDVHNKLQYGEYGIQALQGGRLRWGHLEMIRLTIGRKMDDSRMFAQCHED